MIKHCLLLLFVICALTSLAQTTINFNNPQVKYMGRISMRDSAAEMSWTASSVIINFKGTSAKATIKDDNGLNYMTVVVDDKVDTVIRLAQGKHEYDLASGLTNEKHQLQLFKRTEYEWGTLWLYNITLSSGATLLAPPSYKHRMEFYGNSITAGYAIEDTTGQDRGAYEFENAYKSYANLTARHFNAEYNAIVKSGIGITISWFPYVMPDVYDRVHARDSTDKWDFAKFTPEVVIVNLFQNDAFLLRQPNHDQYKARFGDKVPDPAVFINGYQKFISSIRSKYPAAKIICVLGSMDATKPGQPWPGYIERAVARLNDKDIYTHFFKYKNTPGHPSAAEQQAMANDLIAYMQKTLKW
ncbi:electron transporter RnfD [Mucilaginibacter pallidiroseus]|uniref:Electron transporter RnfD n=1 Tax=Mucilaginibacter pallidiroseus TaxID=2599295 RepID=A0A563UJ03_9SPHI|nr:SGNH/GDSL hydrolase family protein [Mucilaginibacter pallidiroseus]TWR31289.1 electron transporter RnfD [Mucilaginibacter pallidiroseus]